MEKRPDAAEVETCHADRAHMHSVENVSPTSEAGSDWLLTWTPFRIIIGVNHLPLSFGMKFLSK